MSAVLRRVMMCRELPSLVVIVRWVRVAESDECARAVPSMCARAISKGRAWGRGQQCGAEGDSQSVPHRNCMVNVSCKLIFRLFDSNTS